MPRDIQNDADDEARAASAAAIEELKEEVQKAETTTDQYRKQLGVLQMRLDDAVSEHGKLEEQAHEKDEVINSLREEIRELTRQIREMEQAHETELAALLKDKESQASREEELQTTVQRLKETIAQKDLRMSVENDRNLSRSRELCPFCKAASSRTNVNLQTNHSKFQKPVSRCGKRPICPLLPDRA